jgi:hypothetical protein
VILDRREALAATLALTAAGCSRALGARLATPKENRAMVIETRPLLTLFLSTAPTQDLGRTPLGTRLIFPIVGGEFEGERLRGKVLPGGVDWTLRRPDGALELDLRVSLQTDDDALIHLTFTGLRDDAHAYFHTLPRFETAAPKYAFLNRLLAVGTGEMRAGAPVHVIDEIC